MTVLLLHTVPVVTFILCGTFVVTVFTLCRVPAVSRVEMKTYERLLQALLSLPNPLLSRLSSRDTRACILLFTISLKWRACMQASLVQANTHGSYWRDCQRSCLREVVAHGCSNVFYLKFDRPPRNEHCSKDHREDREVYETSESSPRIVASASSRKKKEFVLDSDSEEDCKTDAG